MQRALTWLNLWSWGCQTYRQKCIFCVFRPFFSLCWIIQSYEPKDQFIKFSQKNIENWRFWKTKFFWVGHFDFFFAPSPWKFVTNYVLEWMGLNFHDYDGLQSKITPPKTFQPAEYIYSWQVATWLGESDGIKPERRGT